MDRRTFVSMVAAGAASTLFQGNAAVRSPRRRRATSSSCTGCSPDGHLVRVIARCKQRGSMPRPCKTPDNAAEAVASAQLVLARQDGPTVLVGHSFRA